MGAVISLQGWGAWMTLGMGLIATIGLTLLVSQFQLLRRYPRPFPRYLQPLTGAVLALSAVGWWDGVRHPQPDVLRAWAWCAAGAILLLGTVFVLVQHARAVKFLFRRTAHASSGNFIEEQVLRTHLDQLRKSIAMQDALRDMQRAHLRAQMNPHFLFNVLAGIQNLLLEGSHERASDVFRKFRVLLMQGFLTPHDRMGSLEDEIDHIRQYLELEEIRLPQPIGWSVVLQDGLDPTTVACPLFLLQPLVENAIWHGLTDGTQPHPLLEIHARWEGNDLVLEVHDNGRGLQDRPPAQPKHAAFASRGTQIVRERLALLNMPGSLHIVPAQRGGPFPRGTTSRLRLPFWRGEEVPVRKQGGARGTKREGRNDD